MKITEHQINELKQRLHHVLEEERTFYNSMLPYNDPETFREEEAFIQGRIQELQWVRDWLNDIQTKEDKHNAAVST